MADTVCEAFLTREMLRPRDLESGAESGGIVDFWGVVRLTEEDAEISGIDYEAHPTMAEHHLHRIAEECGERFELQRVLVLHRTGFVPVGEASLFVRVASRHRAEAFRASQWIVDELKKRVPIWKNPRAAVAAELSGAAL